MNTSKTTTVDVIDAILGDAAGGAVATLRADKPENVQQLQAYYLSIFEPAAESIVEFSLAERAAIAVRVASFTRSTAVVAWYESLAREAGIDNDVITRLKAVNQPWSDATRLGAAVRHADLLTTSPSAAQADDLAALKAAGYSPAGILSLSQVIAFVSYQLRLIAGLRAFGVAA